MKRFFPAPKYQVNIETTNHCCLNCFMCCNSIAKKRQGFISLDVVRKSLDDFAKIFTPAEDLLIQLIGQGEPLMHSKIFEIIQLVKGKGFKVDLVTNAVLLDEKKRKALIASPLDELKLSFYGWDRDSYKEIHGKDRFDQALENILMLLREDRKFRISFHLLHCKTTEHLIKRLEELWSRFPVEIVVTYEAQNYRDILNKKNAQHDEEIKVPEGAIVFSQCCLNSPPIIHWDGSVSQCIYDYDSECPIGDISRENYADILKGKAYQEFKKAMIEGKMEEAYGSVFCRICGYADSMRLSNGEIVKLQRSRNRNSAVLGKGRDKDYLLKNFPLKSIKDWGQIFKELLLSMNPKTTGFSSRMNG
ncbi:MAG: radical SAM protein [Candidatus Omnitrophica bacterium]|nr:radical SAM protein [Candidatus Omnitrophota bacterium]